jgi:hypothetical protein
MVLGILQATYPDKSCVSFITDAMLSDCQRIAALRGNNSPLAFEVAFVVPFWTHECG